MEIEDYESAEKDIIRIMGFNCIKEDISSSSDIKNCQDLLKEFINSYIFKFKFSKGEEYRRDNIRAELSSFLNPKEVNKRGKGFEPARGLKRRLLSDIKWIMDENAKILKRPCIDWKALK